MNLFDIDGIMNGDYEVIVKCETDNECVHATQLLLDIGAKHGESGWSKRILRYDFEEYGGLHWRHPVTQSLAVGGVGIEYYSSRADIIHIAEENNRVVITYDKFVSACEKDYTEYEISDDEMNDIFNFLHNA